MQNPPQPWILLPKFVFQSYSAFSFLSPYNITAAAEGHNNEFVFGALDTLIFVDTEKITTKSNWKIWNIMDNNLHLNTSLEDHYSIFMLAVKHSVSFSNPL